MLRGHMNPYEEVGEDEAIKYPGPYDPGPEAIAIRRQINELLSQLGDVCDQRCRILDQTVFRSETDAERQIMNELKVKQQEISKRIRQLLVDRTEAVRRYKGYVIYWV